MINKTDIIKHCKIHGNTLHSKHKRGISYRYRCKQCQIDSTRITRQRIKQNAIAYKGSKCNKCGHDDLTYPEVFEFHHRDPKEKDFAISAKGYSLGWEKVKKELDKCDMYCANCHRIIHSELSSITEILNRNIL